MKIKIVTIGEPKGEYKKIFCEFEKRISRFCNIEIFHLKQEKKVFQKILKIVEKKNVILLDEKGKEFSSLDFSKFLQKQKNSSISEIYFLIGGPDGHDEEILKNFKEKISLSKLTLPHDMAMIFFIETLYRSLSILENHPYHRD